MQTKLTKNYTRAKRKKNSPNRFVISHVFLHWDHFDNTCQKCLSGANESNNLQKYTVTKTTKKRNPTTEFIYGKYLNDRFKAAH